MKLRVLLVACCMLALPQAAAIADHAIDPQTVSAETVPFDTVPVQSLPLNAAPVQIAAALPAAARETCTTTAWVPGEVRTECVTAALPPRKSDPGLRGICITAYGHRTCS